jgi:outer membrane protein with beta-barrel domain
MKLMKKIPPARSKTLAAGALGLTVLSMAMAFAISRTDAAELIPSVGLTRSVDGDDAKSQIGIALRSAMLPPVLHSEIAVGYRREEFFGGDLETKMWPVTVSALVSPLPTLHADAGAGWYNTTYNYKDPLLKDETKQKFGVHMGGGLKMPLGPVAGIDLTGRYVWMQKQESKLVPQKFDPNFWTLSLGLALKI